MFYELDNEGNEDCIVYFFCKPIYIDKIERTEIISMVALPNSDTYNQEDIMIELTNKAYYSKGHKAYYFRVTEEQYDILTKNYYAAIRPSEENMKEVTYTYDELFGEY